MKRDVAYYQKTKPLKIFLSYYRPHIHLFVLDMVCALIICLIDLAFPYISRSALKTLLPQQEYRVFFLIIAFFAVAYIGKGLLTGGIYLVYELRPIYVGIYTPTWRA